MTTIEALHTADEHWSEVVSTLTEPELRAPSLLPGWSRAHVVAHVALNGEAFRRVLTQVAEDRAPSMYDSNEARDRDIDVLAAADRSALLLRSSTVTAQLPDLLAALPEARREVMVSRLPGGGGMTFPVREVLPKRLGEVWIHLADLGSAAFSHHDWPTQFAADLVTQRAPRHPSWGFAATDVDRQWGPPTAPELTLSGPVADLARWLTGRGTGEGLTSSTGAIPDPPGF